MKKILKSFKLSILLSLISIKILAQNQIEKCGSSLIHNQMLNNPTYVQKMNEFELFVKTQHNDPTPKIAAQYRIPVVVHVLHKGEAIGVGTNVSDANIRAAIQELNNRYRKTAGTAGAGNGVDMEIEFALAVRDPNGNCTNGITRVNMTSNSTYMNYGVQSSSSLGITDAQVKATTSWTKTKYYNIYLVSEMDDNNGGAGTQGYAYFAAAHGSSQDGAVILASNFTAGGSMTTTHEMGHALNLYHTFEGDGSGANCPASTNGCGSNAGDCCADTPPHKRSQSDCNTTGTNSCNANSSNSLFVRNYMDYSSDACMNMFTANQKTRALAACAQDRASFFATTNLALTPVAAPVANFSASSSLICSGQTVTFTDLSACVPNTYLPETNWTNMTFSWTFTNGSTVLTSSVQNPTMTFTVAGAYDVSLTVTTSAGTNTITRPAYVVLVGAPINACTPNSTNSGNFGQTISKVAFNTISNTTDTYSNVAYSNFMCSDNTIVEPGITYSLSITANAGPSGAERFEVYIDYNNNGTFENPAELVHSGSVAIGTQSALNTQTLSANVTIPSTAIQNTFLRMRVMADAATISAQKRSCTSAFLIGDVEDYGIYINGVPTAPIANFTSTPTNTGCTGQTVQYTSTSMGNPSTYSWTFTGGTPATSNLQNPTVSYSTPGTYDVTLSVTNSLGNDVSNQPNYITVYQSPTITGTTPNSRCGAGTVSLGAASSIGTINWYTTATGGTSIGTGSNFTTPSISATTNYYAEVSSNGCTSPRSAVIATINNPTVNNPGNTVICLGVSSSPINFSGNNISNTYSWTNNNASIGLSASGNGNIASFTPTGAGSSTITVTPTINGCNGQSISFSITVNDCSTEIDEYKDDLLILYPNPTGGLLTIKGESLNNYNKIELFDAAGRIVSTWNISGNPLNLDLSAYSNGIYNLKISDISNNFTVKKIQIKK